VILSKILDGKDGRLLIILCGVLLDKDDELGKDTAPAYNPNKGHQYRIYNAECYSLTLEFEKCADLYNST
jgi:hypothetical protein